MLKFVWKYNYYCKLGLNYIFVAKYDKKTFFPCLTTYWSNEFLGRYVPQNNNRNLLKSLLKFLSIIMHYKAEFTI